MKPKELLEEAKSSTESAIRLALELGIQICPCRETLSVYAFHTVPKTLEVLDTVLDYGEDPLEAVRQAVVNVAQQMMEKRPK